MAEIKLLITDVDGVMTDGGMYFSSTGEEMKRFNSKDGMAVNLCRQRGIEYGIISAGHSVELVQARARVLNITHVYVGKEQKLDVLNRWMESMSLKTENVAYIGDDLNDIPVMQAVGLSACPANAAKEVKAIASIVLNTAGGQGCVREFVEEHLL
jgi:YrbI family 3-deoxy-D-manno-octulosonate 8-phosphate phosphatase